MLRCVMLFSRTGKAVLLMIATVFLLLRFVHLGADYPGNIRWDDGIATDEGWYASAAINQHLWGTALLPGDMNIPVLMPVWSLVAYLAFHGAGYGITTLRTTACLFFLLCVAWVCFLLRRFGRTDLIPLTAAMLAVNPWAFAFSRSGFLEFPALSFVLLAMLLASGGGAGASSEARLSPAWGASAGLSFGVSLLIKPTLVALAPALLLVLFLQAGKQMRRVGWPIVFVSAGCASVWLPYWWFVLHTHTTDIAFYLSVVRNTLRWNPLGFVADASRPFRYGLGSDHVCFVLALVLLPISLVVRRLRALWKDPVFAIAAVWIASFLAFMVKHNNDPARYFAVIIPAIVMLAAVLVSDSAIGGSRVGTVVTALLLLDMAVNATQISAAMLHPSYSFRNAALTIKEIVQHEPGSQVVIGDNAHELALINGLKPVNLLFHSAPVAEQMQNYLPGWWVQFAPIEDGRCFREVLSLAYTAEYRGEWQMFYPGQRLVLWKLQPIPGASLPLKPTVSQIAACAPPTYQ